MPGRSQVGGLDVLSKADKSALDWVSEQLGSARIQRLFILVAGLSETKWEAEDLHQFLSHQAELARSCKSIIRGNGGRLAQSALTGAIGYWPCLSIEQWSSADLAAKQILKSSCPEAGVSVCLTAGMVLSTPIEILDEVHQQLSGPLIHKALCRRLSTPAGRVQRTAKFENFASEWEIEDRPGTLESQAIGSDHTKKRKTAAYLASRASTSGPVQHSAALDRTLLQLDVLVVIVEAASVLGYGFRLNELAFVLGMCPRALQPLLDLHVIQRFLKRGTMPGGAVEYRFDDPQLCDAAYSRLPSQIIERLHRRAADVMARRQEKYALRPHEFQEIADHCERSGDKLRASDWRLQAGQEAIRRGLNCLAISYLESAVNGPGNALQRSKHPVHSRASHLLACQVATLEGYASRHPHLTDLRSSALGLARCSGRAEKRFNLLWVATKYQLTAGDICQARRMSRHLLWTAREAGDKYQLLAHILAGEAELLGGRLLASCFHFTRAIGLYRSTEHEGLRFDYNADPLALALIYRAWARAALGQGTAALEDAQLALRQARRIDHAFTRTSTTAVLALVHEILNKQVEATIYAMTTVTLANQNHYSYWRAWSEVIQAGLKITNQPAATLQEIVPASQAYRALGARQLLGYVYRKSASASLHIEDIDSATEFALKGIRHCQLTGMAIDLAELHLLTAQCYSRRQHQRAMALHLERALAYARSMRMTPMVERITQATRQLH